MLIAVIILSITLIALLYYIYHLHKQNQFLEDDKIILWDKTQRLQNKLLLQSINRSLVIMDSTHTIFNDEDEGNRELTTCLKLLGHNAIYHYNLNGLRTVDILVDNHAIIEGKLDPSPTDIDRLFGQIDDYLQFENIYIYIVVYGYISNELIERIRNNIILPNQGRITLVYKINPQRTRKSLYPVNLNKLYEDK